jgi:uncharacterized protein (TIGR02001 family)
MKKLMMAAALASILSGPAVQAAEDISAHAFSLNAAVVSDYRFRGFSQTRLKPALQGGADYTHEASGLYAGTWLSTIKWVKDAGGDSDVEIDVYGGKRGAIGGDVSYDIGVLTYVYPSNELSPGANTTEVYGQLGYGPAYAKYSHALTNLFGFADSKNSHYIDIGANIDIAGGVVLNLHAGRQMVKNNAAFSYTDWKVGVTKDFGFAVGAIALIGMDSDAYVGPAPDSRNLGRNALVLSVGKTF